MEFRNGDYCCYYSTGNVALYLFAVYCRVADRFPHKAPA